MFALPDSRLAVANPRWGFDVCLNPRAPSSMLDRIFCGRRPLPFGGSHLRLPSGPTGIRTTTGSLSGGIFNVGRKLKCCSFTFWTEPSKRNWNSLLSCNSINTPSTLTMGSQGLSLRLPLWGPCKERWQYWILKRSAAALQPLRWPHGVCKRCTCRA